MTFNFYAKCVFTPPTSRCRTTQRIHTFTQTCNYVDSHRLVTTTNIVFYNWPGYSVVKHNVRRSYKSVWINVVTSLCECVNALSCTTPWGWRCKDTLCIEIKCHFPPVCIFRRFGAFLVVFTFSSSRCTVVNSSSRTSVVETISLYVRVLYCSKNV
jgi:hypothetical protein